LTIKLGVTDSRTGNLPQHRIRNDLELHEPMVTHDKLEPVGISETTQDNALLIMKTFDLR
jgi:hypothetical protein